VLAGKALELVTFWQMTLFKLIILVIKFRYLLIFILLYNNVHVVRDMQVLACIVLYKLTCCTLLYYMLNNSKCVFLLFYSLYFNVPCH
jgi:hypothetical protein